MNPLDFLFPPHCPYCGTLIHACDMACSSCLPFFPKQPVCMRLYASAPALQGHADKNSGKHCAAFPCQSYAVEKCTGCIRPATENIACRKKHSFNRRYCNHRQYTAGMRSCFGKKRRYRMLGNTCKCRISSRLLDPQKLSGKPN